MVWSGYGISGPESVRITVREQVLRLLGSYNVRVRCVGFGLFSNWSLTEAGLGSYQM